MSKKFDGPHVEDISTRVCVICGATRQELADGIAFEGECLGRGGMELRRRVFQALREDDETPPRDEDG